MSTAVTGAVAGVRCLEDSGNTQVRARGEVFLNIGKNTHSSPLVRATSAAALCPGICLGSESARAPSCDRHGGGRPGAPLIFLFSERKQESNS